MSDYVTDEMVETAAHAAFRDGFMRHAPEHENRDLSDYDDGVRESWRVVARAALEAAVPLIAAAALRSVLDMRHDFEAVWDDGNATGLDGWTGPGRGSGEVDDYAIRARERAVNRLEAHIAARAETTTDLHWFNAVSTLKGEGDE